MATIRSRMMPLRIIPSSRCKLADVEVQIFMECLHSNSNWWRTTMTQAYSTTCSQWIMSCFRKSQLMCRRATAILGSGTSLTSTQNSRRIQVTFKGTIFVVMSLHLVKTLSETTEWCWIGWRGRVERQCFKSTSDRQTTKKTTWAPRYTSLAQQQACSSTSATSLYSDFGVLVERKKNSISSTNSHTSSKQRSMNKWLKWLIIN